MIAVQTTLAWAHLELGDLTVAEALVAQAATQARATNDRVKLVDALRVQAMVVLRQGHCEVAARSLEEGLALTRSIPYPYAEGRLLHVYGQLHLAQGKAGPARERLEAALAIFRRLGARKDAERVSQAIGSLSQNRSSPPMATTVTDSQWAQIQALLRPSRQGPGRPRADDRRTLEAILYVQHTGCAWNRVPVGLGDDATAHRRLQRWQAEGIWEPICRILGLPASAADEEGHAPTSTTAH
jgi:hypothetical protein